MEGVRNRIVIGISGKIGSGKNTACDLIRSDFPFFKELAFAVNVKKVVAILTGSTLEENLDRQLRKRFISNFGATLGELQQKVGNGMRNSVGTNVWIESVILEPSEFKIITDVRFPDEVEAVERVGGIVIRLERSEEHKLEHDKSGEFAGDMRPKDDISETALDNYPFKHRIRNEGTKIELYSELMYTIRKHTTVDSVQSARKAVELDIDQVIADRLGYKGPLPEKPRCNVCLKTKCDCTVECLSCHNVTWIMDREDVCCLNIDCACNRSDLDAMKVDFCTHCDNIIPCQFARWSGLGRKMCHCVTPTRPSPDAHHWPCEKCTIARLASHSE